MGARRKTRKRYNGFYEDAAECLDGKVYTDHDGIQMKAKAGYGPGSRVTITAEATPKGKRHPKYVAIKEQLRDDWVTDLKSSEPEAMTHALQRTGCAKKMGYGRFRRYGAEPGSVEVGEIVKLQIPGLKNNKPFPMNVAGTVKRVFPSGDVEVKTQAHGYHTVPISLVTKR